VPARFPVQPRPFRVDLTEELKPGHSTERAAWIKPATPRTGDTEPKGLNIQAKIIFDVMNVKVIMQYEIDSNKPFKVRQNGNATL
jgi:hypothetical protein